MIEQSCTLANNYQQKKATSPGVLLFLLNTRITIQTITPQQKDHYKTKAYLIRLIPGDTCLGKFKRALIARDNREENTDEWILVS